MKDLLRTGGARTVRVLRTRTGIFGMGPTYGQIIIGAALEYLFQRYEEKSVVRGAERLLTEINEHERKL